MLLSHITMGHCGERRPELLKQHGNCGSKGTDGFAIAPSKYSLFPSAGGLGERGYRNRPAVWPHSTGSTGIPFPPRTTSWARGRALGSVSAHCWTHSNGRREMTVQVDWVGKAAASAGRAGWGWRSERGQSGQSMTVRVANPQWVEFLRRHGQKKPTTWTPGNANAAWDRR